MSAASFTQTRSQVLGLEKQADLLLSQYAKFQNTTSNTTAPSEEENNAVDSIIELFSKRESLINKLTRISETDLSLSTSKLQQLTRHREVFHDQKLAFDKIQTRILDERNRNNLLFSVRSDINEHKQRNVSSSNNQPLEDNDYILDERTRVDNANSFADRLLRLAYETRDELIHQRAYLANAQNKMLGVLQSIPGINVLISKINTRRKRDTLILATVISVCIILLVWL